MLVEFEGAVRAFVDALAITRSIGPRLSAEQVTRAARFVLDVQRKMPLALRLPFWVLTLGFDGWPIPRRGKAFHALPPADRIAQIDTWRRSRFEPRRRFIEFYSSLAAFGLYSELYGKDYQHDPRVRAGG